MENLLCDANYSIVSFLLDAALYIGGIIARANSQLQANQNIHINI